MRQRGISLLLLVVVILSNITSAFASPTYFKIDGDSMGETIKHGDTVKVISEEWDDGDVVIAELKNGQTVIKRVEGDKLVGDGERTKTYKMSEVREIYGKVAVTDDILTEEEGVGKALAAADIDLKENPITDVVTTRETAIFLHKDTSISGIGSNIAGVLGMPGGETNNTGEWVKISGPTGIVELVAGADNVVGLVMDDNDTSKYKMIRLDKDVGDTTKRWQTTKLVKDFSMAGTADANPHQGSVVIDDNGILRAKGSEYNGVGIGSGTPYGFYPNGGGTTFVIDDQPHDTWLKVLIPDGENVIYPTTGTYFKSNENNTGNWTREITPVFTINDDVFTVDIRYREAGMIKTSEAGKELERRRHYYNSETDFNVELFDGNLSDAVISSGATPLKVYNTVKPQRDAGGTKYLPIEDLGAKNGRYKIRITSRNVKWDIRLRERKYFSDFYDAVKVVQAKRGATVYIVTTTTGEVFMNNTKMLNKVIFPEGVKINPETVYSGIGTQFAAIDTKGEMWTWTAYNNAKQVELPTNFYKEYEIEDIAIGTGFFMVKTRGVKNQETNVWVWGTNTYGKLGMGEPGTEIRRYEETGKEDKDGNPILKEVITEIGAVVEKPTKVVRANGEPITNIESIAGGENFSVIVQNTNEGQLVWTSGLNNSGQLGGGVTLVNTAPTLLNGASNIDRINPVLTELLMFNDSDEKVYTSGGGLSYIREAKLHPSIGYYPTQFYAAEYRINSPMYVHAVYVGAKGEGHHTRTYNSTNYNNGTLYDLLIDEGNRYRADGSTEYLDFKPINNGDRVLKNIEKAIPHAWGTMLLDRNGRIWSAIDNSWGGADYANGQGGAYNSVGELNPAGYVGRGIGRAPNLRPARVNFNTIEQTKFIDIGRTTKINTTNVTAVAISDKRELYKLSLYTEKMNHEGINGKADKLFSMFNSVALVTTDNEVYVWGNNGGGRLGTGNNTTYSTPQQIPKSYFQNERVVDITGNEYVTLFLTETGKVFGAGTNTYNLLGDSSIAKGEVYSRPTLINQLSGLDLKTIKLGENYGAAVDKDKRVWAWGYAAEGSLGDNFTSNRNFYSTAVGNDLPQMTLLDPIERRYYSINSINPDKKQIKIRASVVEPDFERTTIYADMYGQRKTVTIPSYEKDYYDEPVPQEIDLVWDLKDIKQKNAIQSLTKIVAEDIRGGLIEQFIASDYIIDEEAPIMPQWEDIYRIDTDESGKETTVKLNVGSNGKYSSTNNPIKITTQLTQKQGQNRAPVDIQYQYRRRQPWGYPQWENSNDPNNWTTVEGNAMEFFKGFNGETEIRIRAIDRAGNVSPINPETKRLVIGDAGVEIVNLKAKPVSETNNLYNELTFDANSGSKLQEYTIERQSDFNVKEILATEVIKEKDNVYRDVKDLRGNLTYTYYVTGKNLVGKGVAEEVKVTTHPYAPIDKVTRVNEEKNGIILTVKQNQQNHGKITYRMVIIDSKTGRHYQEDIKTENALQDAVFKVDSKKAGIEITNNPIDIKLLYKGDNDVWLEVDVEREYVVSPTQQQGDNEAPKVASFTVNNGARTMYADGINNVSLQVRALDDTTAVSELQVRFSLDGYTWIGKDAWGRWKKDTWLNFSTDYPDFPLGELKDKKKSEKRVIYTAVRDKSGNIGYGYTEISVLSTEEPLLTPPTSIDKGSGSQNTWDGPSSSKPGIEFETGTGKGKSFIYLNAEQAQIKLSDYFNIDDIKIGGEAVQGLLLQYSFDGVTWSAWEPAQFFSTKQVTLPIGDGLKTIHIRGKQPQSELVGESMSRRFILDTHEPTIQIRSASSTFIAVNGNIKLDIELRDNMVTSVPFKIETYRFSNGVYTKISEAEGASKGRRVVPVDLKGLPEGQIKVVVTAEDGAKNFAIAERVLWSKKL